MSARRKAEDEAGDGAGQTEPASKPARGRGAARAVRGAVETAAVESAAARVKPTTVATPWGRAAVVEEVALEQHAGDRSFASLVQLVETPDGERLVRFAYTTDGVARRGPVTLRQEDLARLRTELAERPALAEALLPGGGA